MVRVRVRVSVSVALLHWCCWFYSSYTGISCQHVLIHACMPVCQHVLIHIPVLISYMPACPYTVRDGVDAAPLDVRVRVRKQCY